MPSGYAFVVAAVCHDPSRLPPELVPTASPKEAREIISGSSKLTRIEPHEIIEKLFGSDQLMAVDVFIQAAEDGTR